jgi:hypothetical protein
MTTKAKSQKPKRTLAAIRAEKAILIEKVEAQVKTIRAFITGKIPDLVRNGSHGDAVEFKDLCEKNANLYGCSPSFKKQPAHVMQKRIDSLAGTISKFNRFYG